MSFPEQRPRRLRRSPAMRRMVAETRLHPADLILPVFVREGLTAPAPISSMPGVVQHTEASLLTAAEEARDLGLAGIMLFGIPATRDAQGSAGLDPDGILNRSIRAVKDRVGDDLVVMSDLCLDEFTDHGHCGLVDETGEVDNDATLEVYAEMGVAQAAAGADVVAPSGMMDGQVAVIRQALDEAGHQHVPILAYAAKYASGFYGPFREAVDSQLTGDRKQYQMDAPNRTEALREVELDLAEGADMVMVKPASAYLDILSDTAAISDVPVSAYQVSGEYAMIEAAAANGWINRRTVITESLIAIRRAGATNVLTYYAAEVAGWLREELAGPRSTSAPAAPVPTSSPSAPSASTPVHPRVEPHTTAAPVEASAPGETAPPTRTDGESTDEPRTDAGFPPVS
ncbi:porphobilinogen synthase [Nesterenkonia sandarakina]|uniref:Delta-aminolevulinic acid dehydratase n=1 Tax=Nesterenkonia sandarakina TaxID=272918 RepID=A0A2T0YIQ4_9MICC|nr:porphobilinogen synthase [Nesterenkonia sandarakina]